MKNRFRIVTAVVTALVLVSSVASQAARSHPLDEDAALALLVRTLKHDRVYAKRISLDCITYDTEETTDAYFQFALREKHDPKLSKEKSVTRLLTRSGNALHWL